MQGEYVKQVYKSDLGYQVQCVSGTQARRAYSAELHCDTSLTVAYFKKAEGNIKIEGNNYDLASGDMIILNYNEMHCADIQSDFCERITLYISETIYNGYAEPVNELLRIFTERNQGTQNKIPASVVKAYKLDDLLEEISLCASRQTPVSELIGLGKITEFLSTLNRAVAKVEQVQENTYTNNPIVNQVIQYISHHFAEDITCESIAGSMYLSKHYVGKLFKDAVGISLWNYIINRRLLHFNDLLRQNYLIEEACSLSGFHNYSNFYKLYKRRTGISPQEFKRRIAHTKES